MLNLDYSTFPVLRTERLVLRRLVPEHAIRLHQLRSDAEINRYIYRTPSTSVSDALAFINKINDLVASKKSLYWVVTLAGNNTLIGTVCLWNYDLVNDTIELGYELMTDEQGKGIMAEAVTKVIDYGFNQLNADAIIAFTIVDNARSVALLKKFNFKVDLSLQTDDNPEVPYVLNETNSVVILLCRYKNFCNFSLPTSYEAQVYAPVYCFRLHHCIWFFLHVLQMG